VTATFQHVNYVNTLTTNTQSTFNITATIMFLDQQHKAAGIKIRLSKNNDHDGVSHGVECSQEGDRILSLKSNR